MHIIQDAMQHSAFQFMNRLLHRKKRSQEDLPNKLVASHLHGYAQECDALDFRVKLCGFSSYNRLSKKKSELKGEEKHTSDAQSLARPNLHALKDKMVHEEG